MNLILSSISGHSSHNFTNDIGKKTLQGENRSSEVSYRFELSFFRNSSLSLRFQRLKFRREEKPEEPELPKYRDRAKERREDQNPDYEPTELGSFHAVAPPGAVDILAADAHKISIEKSKYLGGLCFLYLYHGC